MHIYYYYFFNYTKQFSNVCLHHHKYTNESKEHAVKKELSAFSLAVVGGGKRDWAG